MGWFFKPFQVAGTTPVKHEQTSSAFVQVTA